MKAIIFDFGGTLDTNGIHWCEFFRDVYKKFNVGVPNEEYERAYVEGEKEMLKMTGSLRDVLKQQLNNQFRYLGHLRIIPLSPHHTEGGSSTFEGAKGESGNKLIEKMADYCYNEASNYLKKSREILSVLKKNFKLGIVSNFYGNMAEVCNEFGIDVDAIVDSSLVGIRKPDKKIFEIALSRLGAKPEDTFVVGDSYKNDIVPAKSLGCKTVWLKGRSWDDEERSLRIPTAADFVISSLEEIKEIVNNSDKGS